MPRHPGRKHGGDKEKMDVPDESANDSPPAGLQMTKSVTEQFLPGPEERERRVKRPFGAFSPATFPGSDG